MKKGPLHPPQKKSLKKLRRVRRGRPRPTPARQSQGKEKTFGEKRTLKEKEKKTPTYLTKHRVTTPFALELVVFQQRENAPFKKN